MNNIYEKLSDLHVRGTYVYVKSNDQYAYKDANFKEKFDGNTLMNAFNMNTAIVVDGGVHYRPSSMVNNDGVIKLNYIKSDVTTVTTAVLSVVYSKEYTSDDE